MRSYRENMRDFAGLGNLAVWYAQSDEKWVEERFGEDVSERGRDRWTKALAEARSHDTLQVFDKLIVVVDAERRIAPDPPLITRLEDLMPDTGEAGLSSRSRG